MDAGGDASDMDHVTIEVRGMGGCFDDVMEIICQCLTQQGAKVTVIDEYPPKERSQTLQTGREITVKAVNLPWGG